MGSAALRIASRHNAALRRATRRCTSPRYATHLPATQRNVFQLGDREHELILATHRTTALRATPPRDSSRLIATLLRAARHRTTHLFASRRNATSFN